MPDADSALLERARALLREHPVIDGHNDLPWQIRQHTDGSGDLDAYDLTQRTVGHTDLPRLRAGGVGGQFWSVYVPAEVGGGYARMQLEQLDLARRMIERYPDDLVLCRTADEAERAFASGRIASMLGMEGGHVLEGSLGALRAFRDLGAAYLTLTHNRNTEWADSATDEPVHGGLTDLGRAIVREMNRIGMLVDLSHVAPTTMADALDVATRPGDLQPLLGAGRVRRAAERPGRHPAPAAGERRRVHAHLRGRLRLARRGCRDRAGARGDQPAVGRDRRPGQLRAIRDEVMEGIEVPRPTVADVADHVEHVARVAGVEHVGIGGDFDGSLIWPVGLEDVSSYPVLFAELMQRGWTDADLAALAGRNVLRVMRAAEAVAGGLGIPSGRRLSRPSCRR